MQAVRLKLAGGKPKVVPPDEAQWVWKGRQEHPIRVQTERYAQIQSEM